MEYDRYAHHHKLYIIGMICLLLTLILFTLSMYIVPYLIWDLDYHVPELVLNLHKFFNEDLHFSLNLSNLFVWLCFFLPALFTGIASFLISNYIDNEWSIMTGDIPLEQPSPKEEDLKSEDLRETTELSLKIIFYMILALAALFLLQLIVTS
jgi:hypothetical protein